jgi:hypothetical protein
MKASKTKAELAPDVVPAHLSVSSAEIWRAVNAEYDLSTADLSTLEIGLSHRDLAAAARDALRREGFTHPGTSKMHPAVVASKTHDSVYLAAIRQLGLHLGEAK